MLRTHKPELDSDPGVTPFMCMNNVKRSFELQNLNCASLVIAASAPDEAEL